VTPFAPYNGAGMLLLQPPQFEEHSPCPYLPGKYKRYEFFLAHQLTAEEIARCLDEGWRKFGPYFFRPACPACRACTPLRVPTANFVPSRSQRRVLRQNADLRVEFGPLRPDDRLFALYREHSRVRFDREVGREEFMLNFYLPSCPALQTEIYCGGNLVGAGFLDVGADCLSSVYFFFDPIVTGRSLGIYSVLREIEHARRLGLPFYHLGYYVPECPSMRYKDHFRPRDHFDWESQHWQPVAVPPNTSHATP